MILPFSPRPWQVPIIEHLLKHRRCAAFAGMGLGKTASVISSLLTLDRIERVFPMLVAAPLQVARSVWSDEATKWDQFSGLRVQPVLGTLPERLDALKRQAEIYTVNYEQLPWLIEHLDDRWPFKAFVADESVRLQSYRTRQGGKRAQALGEIAHTKIDRFIALTGTPTPAGYQNLWGQLFFLDGGQRLGTTYSAFIERWFCKGFGEYEIKLQNGAKEQIDARIKDICLSIRPEDWFDVKKPMIRNVYVDLPPRARKLYRDMEREFFMKLDQHEIEAANAGVKSIKLLQCAAGACYVDDKGNWEELHDEKIQALDRVIGESGGQNLLVSYFFKSDLARLQRAFPAGRILDRDPQTIRDWNAGKIRLLFAHPGSAGHGLSLQEGGNIIVHFSFTYNLEWFQQINERLGFVRQLQSGLNRTVVEYRIIARDTQDERALDVLDGKATLQESLMSALTDFRRRNPSV